MKTTTSSPEVQALRSAARAEKKRQRDLREAIDTLKFCMRSATTNRCVASASPSLLAAEARAERERRMASDLQWAVVYSHQLRKDDGGAFSRFMAATLDPVEV